MPQYAFPTPLGDLTLTEEDNHLVSVDWGRGQESVETPLLKSTRQQLDDYFDGKLTVFDLPLNPAGTAFQKRAWRALSKIPAGKTRSYGQLAKTLKSAPRAVGGACARNPIPIIIPCHRVLAAGGLSGGYTAPGGLETKAYLLQLEGVDLPTPRRRL